MLAQAAPATARAVEAQLLPEATGLSLGRLKARTLELLLELDADAVDARRKEAKRRADVRAYPSPLEGMSTLAADLPAPVTADCFDVVDQLAAMLEADGDPRPIGELRAAVLAELIRRPWDTRLPAITARLHVTAQLSSLAGHSTEPGDVSGQPITARHLRELVAQSGFLGLQTPECGSLTFGITDADGRLPATASGSTLERLARRGCAQHADGDCRCSSLGRPAPTAGYSPTRAQGDSFAPETERAGSPTAGSGQAGPIWITSSRIPAAARLTAPTSAACVAATTDSRPSLRDGSSGWTRMVSCMSPPRLETRGSPARQACDHLSRQGRCRNKA